MLSTIQGNTDVYLIPGDPVEQVQALGVLALYDPAPGKAQAGEIRHTAQPRHGLAAGRALPDDQRIATL
jgi:hypothetical protein